MNYDSLIKKCVIKREKKSIKWTCWKITKPSRASSTSPRRAVSKSVHRIDQYLIFVLHLRTVHWYVRIICVSPFLQLLSHILFMSQSEYLTCNKLYSFKFFRLEKWVEKARERVKVGCSNENWDLQLEKILSKFSVIFSSFWQFFFEHCR